MASASDCRFFSPRSLLTEYDHTTVSPFTSCTLVAPPSLTLAQEAIKHRANLAPADCCRTFAAAAVNTRVARSSLATTVTGTCLLVIAADRNASRLSAVGVMKRAGLSGAEALCTPIRLTKSVDAATSIVSIGWARQYVVIDAWMPSASVFRCSSLKPPVPVRNPCTHARNKSRDGVPGCVADHAAQDELPWP